MSIYSSGVVRVTAGSSILRFAGADVQSNAAVGYKFKLREESVAYTIAAIYSATKAALSTRYSNTNYQTAISSEHLGTANALLLYSGTLAHTPVIQTSFVSYIATERFTDDGAGVLTSQCGGTGTISYDDGSWSVTLGVSHNGSALTASYFYGRIRNGMPYQILSDRTANYNIPKIGINDANQAYIISIALDRIDELIASLAASI